MAHFTINERLARWLLMCQDRVDSHEFPMTHKFLANHACGQAGRDYRCPQLSWKGKKSHPRHAGPNPYHSTAQCLEDMAGGAYGVPEQEYKRLIT